MLKNLTPQIMNKLKNQLSNSKVVVIGDITCDINFLCNVNYSNQIMPSGFREISSGVPPTNGKAGAAGVISRVLSLIGVPVKLYGAIGNDKYGQEVIDSLGEDIFKSNSLPDVATSVKCRYYIQSATGSNIPFLKVNHNALIEAQIPYNFRRKLIKESLESTAGPNDNEILTSAVVLADYGKGLIDGQLVSALSETLLKFQYPPNRIELTLLTRNWKDIYRDMHFTHIFWDASEYVLYEGKNISDLKIFIQDAVREWFRKMRSCRTLIVTINAKHLFYFRNESYRDSITKKKGNYNSKSPNILARSYQFNLQRIPLDPDYTGFRSVLAATYIGLRAATNNLAEHELQPIHENHFEYSINAAASQLNKLGTDLPSRDDLFERMALHELFDPPTSTWLDTKMTLRSLKIALNNTVKSLERKGNDFNNISQTQKELNSLINEYVDQETPIIDRLNKLQENLYEIKSLNNTYGKELDDLVRQLINIEHQGEKIDSEKENVLKKVLSKLSKNIDKGSIIELIKILKDMTIAIS